MERLTKEELDDDCGCGKITVYDAVEIVKGGKEE